MYFSNIAPLSLQKTRPCKKGKKEKISAYFLISIHSQFNSVLSQKKKRFVSNNGVVLLVSC